MSGSIAAISAFNGTGTQGTATTDRYTAGVRSVFWNNNDTDVHFVNGSCLSQITANRNEAKGSDNESMVFTVENDIDAINDFVLFVETKSKLPFKSDLKTDSDKSLDVPIYFMANFINRIEISVGNQTISEINTTGIKKYFLESTIRHVYHDGSPVVSNLGKGLKNRNSNFNNNRTWSTTFPLPIFSLLTPDVNSSFLMACANHQTFQIRVFTQNLNLETYNTNVSDTFDTEDPEVAGSDLDIKLKCELYANRISMSNAERSYLRRNPLPKRTFITQYSSNISNRDSTNIIQADGNVSLICDHFNLYTSAIYVVADASAPTHPWPKLDVDLVLNSTSFSETLPFQLVVDQLDNTELWYFKIELGNSMKPIIARNIGSVTDQNFVPLSRFDSIKITLKNQTGTDLDLGSLFFKSLCAIAVGKTTARYEKGAVTFNHF